MKKKTILVVISLTCMVFCACGSKNNSKPSNGVITSAQSEEKTKEFDNETESIEISEQNYEEIEINEENQTTIIESITSVQESTSYNDLKQNDKSNEVNLEKSETANNSNSNYLSENKTSQGTISTSSTEKSTTSTTTSSSSAEKSTTRATISHTHIYNEKKVDSTCTKDGYIVYTCNCGDNFKKNIVAKGHSWIAATCTTKRTCSLCGKTEGNILGHSYSNYKCTKCNMKDEAGIAVNPLLSLKKGITYAAVKQGDTFLSVNYYVFKENSDIVSFGSEIYTVTPYITDEKDPYYELYNKPYIYNGITYYTYAGKGDSYKYILNDSEIIVYYKGTEKKIIFSLGVDGKITVTYNDGVLPEVGTVYEPFQFE